MSDADDLRGATEFLAGEVERDNNAVYAVYVAVIAAGAYGVPAAQAFFRVLDPTWMAAHLSGPSAVALAVAALAVATTFGYRLGGIRGPVVPDLPYLDTVAMSPLDRALVLRPWWRLSVFGCLVGGFLIGLVISAGLAIAAVASPVVLVPGVLVGTVAGLLVAASWLHGQVRTWPTGDRGARVFLRQRKSLRALHLTSLRTQSARSVTIGGAVLVGDLRAARLDVGPPSARGRRIRLRPHGAISTMVLRDWLGWRRSPGSALTGLVLTAGAAYGLVRSAEPGTPSVIALGSLVLGYLGVSTWSEGLRLQGDNAGTPPLIGLAPMRETLAHLVLPGVGYLLTVLVMGGVSLAAGHASALGLIWAVLLLGILLAAQVMAAFRGLPPVGLFSPTTGVPVTILWYSVPLLTPVVCGTAATAALTAARPSTAVLVLGVTTYAAALYARRRVRVLFEGHRA
ncbi:MAG: hypothetical protein M3Y26_00920 [Actinomycetota bacterium]|nr:hypothetical protein [Actinomycetota bacterium]